LRQACRDGSGGELDSSNTRGFEQTLVVKRQLLDVLLDQDLEAFRYNLRDRRKSARYPPGLMRLV
jgi:hypothetical protein